MNAVLVVVHPEMYVANRAAIPLLLMKLTRLLPSWPSVYHAMDIIANWLTPVHNDSDGAATFYDHLVSLGHDHDAKLILNELDGEFSYKPGTSVLFSGQAFYHSVPMWSRGERTVIVHYAKDEIHRRINVARPSLPTQLGWWSKYHT